MLKYQTCIKCKGCQSSMVAALQPPLITKLCCHWTYPAIPNTKIKSNFHPWVLNSLPVRDKEAFQIRGETVFQHKGTRSRVALRSSTYDHPSCCRTLIFSLHLPAGNTDGAAFRSLKPSVKTTCDCCLCTGEHLLERPGQQKLWQMRPKQQQRTICSAISRGMTLNISVLMRSDHERWHGSNFTSCCTGEQNIHVVCVAAESKLCSHDGRWLPTKWTFLTFNCHFHNKTILSFWMWAISMHIVVCFVFARREKMFFKLSPCNGVVQQRLWGQMLLSSTLRDSRAANNTQQTIFNTFVSLYWCLFKQMCTTVYYP